MGHHGVPRCREANWAARSGSVAASEVMGVARRRPQYRQPLPPAVRLATAVCQVCEVGMR